MSDVTNNPREQDESTAPQAEQATNPVEDDDVDLPEPETRAFAASGGGQAPSQAPPKKSSKAPVILLTMLGLLVVLGLVVYFLVYVPMIEEAKWTEAAAIAGSIRSSLNVHLNQHTGVNFEPGERLPWEQWAEELGMSPEDLLVDGYFSPGDIYLTVEEAEGRDVDWTVHIVGRGHGNDNPEAPWGTYVESRDGRSEVITD